MPGTQDVIENDQPLDELQPEPLAGQPEESAPTPRQRKPRRGWKWVAGNAVIALFAVVVIVLVWSFVNRAFLAPPVEPQTMADGKAHTIQLDVLNGTGTPKLSQRFTDYLRARGFDVVEMGNYKDSHVERTQVIDRAGNLAAAQQVAAALGVPNDRVIRQIDRKAYLDVSVVIGKDYRLLKPID